MTQHTKDLPLKITTDMIVYRNTWGGSLLRCKKSGDIFFCCEDEKTYYEKWNKEAGEFVLFEWRCGGLTNYDLKIINDDELEN